MTTNCDAKRKFCSHRYNCKSKSTTTSLFCLYIIPALVLQASAIQESPSTTGNLLQVDNNNLTTTSGEILLSGDEFVDYTEAPTILFDSLNSANDTTPGDVTTSQAGSNITSSTSSTEDADNVATNPTVGETDSSTNGTDTSEDDTSATGSTDAQPAPFEAPQNVSQYMDYIERLFHDLRHQITDLFEPHLPQLIRSSQMVQLSGSCSYDMLRMALALRQFEPWALRMIDSSGKVPEGIFEGSFTALGSYDECINTVFASTVAPSEQLSSTGNQQTAATQGKYCLVSVSPYLPPKPPTDRVERMFQEEANRRNYSSENQFSRLSPMFYYMKFRIGVCLPSSCADSDMESISGALSSSLRLNITIPHCRVKQTVPITNHQLAGGLIFGLVLLLVIGATTVDYQSSKIQRQQALLMQSLNAHAPIDELAQSKKLPGGWLSTFSLLTNFRLFFKQKSVDLLSSNKEAGTVQREAPGTSNMVRCLNGIRVLSLCWVIIANSYITLDPRATKRLTKTREAPRDFLFQVVVQASLAIETFFFLSGLLMSMSFNRLLFSTDDRSNKKRSSWLNWIQLYLHRYIRMTPPTMLVIAFTMFAFRYGDGPLWFEATNKAHMSCSQNWWRHLLHVANFIDTRQMCFIHYWYIAADMQLFLLAPPLLYLLYKRPQVGYLLAALAGLSSVVSVFYTTYTRNLPPTLLFYNSDPESRREFGNTVMTKPLTHALPYIVGMLLGKWLSQNSNRKLDQHQPSSLYVYMSEGFVGSERFKRSSVATLLGILATLVALGEVFMPYKWNNSHLPTRFLGALYASLFRLAWSLVLAYLVVSCQHPQGRRCLKKRQLSRLQSRDQTQLTNPVDLIRARSGRGGVQFCLSCKPELAQTQMVSIEKPANVVMCLCSRGGSLLNRFLALKVFVHLSRLSFVAYLIHLPLMSVFVAQTRGLFAFSHMLVIHLALSYLLMTFMLSFVLVHIIEFPFITFERYLFDKLSARLASQRSTEGSSSTSKKQVESNSDGCHDSTPPEETKMYVMGNFVKPATMSDKSGSFKVSIRL